MKVGVSRLFFLVEMFILRRYNRRLEIMICRGESDDKNS